MPTTWKLQYPLLTEDSQHICRHHLASLQHDANVYSVTFTRDIGQDHAIIDVIFKDGVDQPATPELRSLDRRYPSASAVFYAREQYSVPLVPPNSALVSADFFSGMRSVRSSSMYQQYYAAYYGRNDPAVSEALDFHATFPFSAVSMGTTVSVSPEFGVSTWRQRVPSWVKPFAYAKETATGIVSQIQDVVPCPEVSSGFILAKLCDDPKKKIAVLVDVFEKNYEETEKPVVRPTWHQHLMTPDDGL